MVIQFALFLKCDLISRINQVKLHSIQYKSLKVSNELKASTGAMDIKTAEPKLKNKTYFLVFISLF